MCVCVCAHTCLHSTPPCVATPALAFCCFICRVHMPQPGFCHVQLYLLLYSTHPLSRHAHELSIPPFWQLILVLCLLLDFPSFIHWCIHLTNSHWALTTSPRSQQWNITLCFFTGTLERIKKTLSLVENLKSCLTECRRRSRQQRIRWSESITHSMDMSLSKLREMMAREALHVAVRGVAKRQTWISDWTTTTATTNLIEWPRNKPSDQGKGARQPMAN